MIIKGREHLAGKQTTEDPKEIWKLLVFTGYTVVNNKACYVINNSQYE